MLEPSCCKSFFDVSYEIVTRRIGELIEELDLCVIGALVIANLARVEAVEDRRGLGRKPKIPESLAGDRTDLAVLGISRVVASVHIQIGADDGHGLHV